MFRFFNYIFYLIIVLVGITFACLNAAKVKINFYVGVYTLPLSLVILLSIGIGILIGMLSIIIKLLKLKSENRRFRQRIKVLDKEVSNLRIIPLRDPP